MADFPDEQLKCVDDPARDVWTVDNASFRAGATLQPVAGIVVTPRCRGLSAASVYLLRGLNPTGAAVPLLEWELRGRIGGRSQSEAITGASGALVDWVSWDTEGSIVHVSGRRYLGFELWGKSSGAEVLCVVQFIVAPASAGSPVFVQAGELV